LPSDSSITGSAIITAATDTTLEIAVDASQPGMLVITDAWYPGWQAQVNGHPAELYRADAMFRAVPVPAGQSTVTLTYAPDWLNWVFAVGAAAWGIVALWVLWWMIAPLSRPAISS